MPVVKEPKYFLTEGKPPRKGGPNDNQAYKNYVWDRDEYRALFSAAPASLLRGEATPHYLGSAVAHRKMAREIPNAKLIAVLRDPSRRAYSHWRYMVSNGQESIQNFVEACHAGEARLDRGWTPDWGYLELGRYGTQLRDLRQYYPQEQLLLLKYEDVVRDSTRELAKLWNFLGVADPELSLPWENRTNEVVGGLRGRGLAIVLQLGFQIRDYVPDRLRHLVSARIYQSYRRPPGECVAGGPDQYDLDQVAALYTDEIEILCSEFSFDPSGWNFTRSAG